MLASDHFDLFGYIMDDYQQSLRYPHGCRVVLPTFSRNARKTGSDHDEPVGAIYSGYLGTGQGNFSGPAMPVHSESKKSNLPDRQIFAPAALPHTGDSGPAGGCHGGQMLFAGKQSSTRLKAR